MGDDLDDILEVCQERRLRGSRKRPTRSGREFPALQIIAGIHKVVAVIAFLVGLIGVLIVSTAPQANALAVVILLAWTLLAPLFLWGSGELILVFLRIEQNTRRTTEIPSSPDRLEGRA